MQGTGQSCSTYWLSRRVARDHDNSRTTEHGLTKKNGDREPIDDDDGECLELVVVVDCRPTEAYNTAHVRGAVSLSLPTLMTRRLAQRKLSASTVIGVIEQRQQGQRQLLTLDSWKQRSVIFYDNSTSASISESGDWSSTSNSCLVMMLAQRFIDDGYAAMILDGRFYHWHFEFDVVFVLHAVGQDLILVVFTSKQVAFVFFRLVM